METTKEVEKLTDFGTSVWYRTSCQCMSDEHILTIELEYDNELKMVTMMFYMKCCIYPKFRSLKYFKSKFIQWIFEKKEDIKLFFQKLKMAWKIIITGYIELEEGFIFRGKDHIQDLITALQEGLEKVQWEQKQKIELEIYKKKIQELEEKIKTLETI